MSQKAYLRIAALRRSPGRPGRFRGRALPDGSPRSHRARVARHPGRLRLGRASRLVRAARSGPRRAPCRRRAEAARPRRPHAARRPRAGGDQAHRAREHPARRAHLAVVRNRARAGGAAAGSRVRHRRRRRADGGHGGGRGPAPGACRRVRCCRRALRRALAGRLPALRGARDERAHAGAGHRARAPARIRGGRLGRPRLHGRGRLAGPRRAGALALPDCPTIRRVRLVDLAWCLLVSVVAAVVVVAFGTRPSCCRSVSWRARPVAVLVSTGVAIGALAVVFRALADRPVDLVLFSGQSSLPTILAEGSGGVLVLLVLAKGLAYTLSLAAGFRGGPVFPAITIGVALGVLAHIVLPDLDLVPAVVAGIAASTAGVLRMPFFAASWRRSSQDRRQTTSRRLRSSAPSSAGSSRPLSRRIEPVRRAGRQRPARPPRPRERDRRAPHVARAASRSPTAGRCCWSTALGSVRARRSRGATSRPRRRFSPISWTSRRTSSRTPTVASSRSWQRRCARRACVP